MDIRQLQYLVALAREKHFTRAAQACNVTQPTLSGRIRQLELELGVPIVERGQRYQGLTQEGERVLKWAQLILNNWTSMHQELAHLAISDFGLTGRLALGAIPSALPMIPYLTRDVQRLHPQINFTIMSMSSEEILRGLNDYSIDAGITYLDNEPINGLLATPLYIERYCLFIPDGHPLAEHERVTWREAAELPLGLLTTNMQNRRIIDRAFQSRRLPPGAGAGDQLRHQPLFEREAHGARERHAPLPAEFARQRPRPQSHSARRTRSRPQRWIGDTGPRSCRTPRPGFQGRRNDFLSEKHFVRRR